MERAILAREALAYDLGVLVDEHRRLRRLQSGSQGQSLPHLIALLQFACRVSEATCEYCRALEGPHSAVKLASLRCKGNEKVDVLTRRSGKSTSPSLHLKTVSSPCRRDIADRPACALAYAVP